MGGWVGDSNIMSADDPLDTGRVSAHSHCISFNDEYHFTGLPPNFIPPKIITFQLESGI